MQHSFVVTDSNYARDPAGQMQDTLPFGITVNPKNYPPTIHVLLQSSELKFATNELITVVIAEIDDLNGLDTFSTDSLTLEVDGAPTGKPNCVSMFIVVKNINLKIDGTCLKTEAKTYNVELTIIDDNSAGDPADNSSGKT